MKYTQIEKEQKMAGDIKSNCVKKDLRFIKTEAGIQTAFILLLQEKSFDSITIQDILNKALINRKTFYSHYCDKFDLAQRMSDNLYERMKGYLDFRNTYSLDFQSYLKQVEKIYNRFYEEKKEILALWNIRTDKLCVYDRLIELLKKEYVNMSINSSPTYDIEFQSYLYANLQMSALKYILESDRKFTAEKVMWELKKLYQTVMNVGIDIEKNEK